MPPPKPSAMAMALKAIEELEKTLEAAEARKKSVDRTDDETIRVEEDAMTIDEDTNITNDEVKSVGEEAKCADEDTMSIDGDNDATNPDENDATNPDDNDATKADDNSAMQTDQDGQVKASDNPHPVVDISDTSDTDTGDFAKYIDPTARLASFAGAHHRPAWPHAEPRAEAVSAAGFFHQPSAARPDSVRCPHCGRSCAGFTPGNAWQLLAHDADCPFRRNIKSAKQRLCRDCDIFFGSIGSKLNHSKRVHPKPEEVRAEKRRERQEAKLRRQMNPGGARRGRKPRAAVAAAAAAAAAATGAGEPRTPLPGHRMVLAHRRPKVPERLPSPEEGLPRMGWNAINIEPEEQRAVPPLECAMVPEKDVETAMPEKATGESLAPSRPKVVVNSAPSVWAGEVVMSRAEYREFRQHFRALTRIFKDVER